MQRLCDCPSRLLVSINNLLNMLDGQWMVNHVRHMAIQLHGCTRSTVWYTARTAVAVLYS